MGGWVGGWVEGGTNSEEILPKIDWIEDISSDECRRFALSVPISGGGSSASASASATWSIARSSCMSARARSACDESGSAGSSSICGPQCVRA